MEPLMTAVVAVGSIVSTKALEKTGQKLGEIFCDKTGHFLSSLRQESPETVTAIEQAHERSLDYGKTIPEVENLIKIYPQVAQAAQDLEEAARNEPNINIEQIIEDIINKLKSSSTQPTVANNTKLADSIKNVFQGNTFIGGTF